MYNYCLFYLTIILETKEFQMTSLSDTLIKKGKLKKTQQRPRQFINIDKVIVFYNLF